MRFFIVVAAGVFLSACSQSNVVPRGTIAGSGNVAVPLQLAVTVTPSSTITGITVTATGHSIGGIVTSSGACASTGCSFNAAAPNDDAVSAPHSNIAVRLFLTFTAVLLLIPDRSVQKDASS